MHCLLVEDIFASVHPPTGAEKKATAPATSNTHSDQQLQHSTSTRRWYVGFLLVGREKTVQSAFLSIFAVLFSCERVLRS